MSHCAASTADVPGLEHAVRCAPSGARRDRLDGGRWHFQHGPIDCVIGADGDALAVEHAVERAWRRFEKVLAELVAELPQLRADLRVGGDVDGPKFDSRSAAPGCRASDPRSTIAPQGAIARRMVGACRPHAAGGRFITAMAAVAGSVAEELMASLAAPGIERAYVNNGGDIALHLGPGATYHVGLIADLDLALLGAAPDGRFCIDAASRVRGIATSGWRGRSLSFGIADSVTVLAASASVADAAATMIANAVYVDDPRIGRAPANQLRDDSDLGERLATCAVPALPPDVVGRALAAGLDEARAQIDAGRVIAVVLMLQGQWRACAAGTAFDTLAPSRRPHMTLARDVHVSSATGVDLLPAPVVTGRPSLAAH